MTNKDDTETEALLLSLADNMASAATTFNAHGYDSFIQARENFKDTLHKILDKTREQFKE